MFVPSCAAHSQPRNQITEHYKTVDMCVRNVKALTNQNMMYITASFSLNAQSLLFCFGEQTESEKKFNRVSALLTKELVPLQSLGISVQDLHLIECGKVWLHFGPLYMATGPAISRHLEVISNTTENCFSFFFYQRPLVELQNNAVL